MPSRRKTPSICVLVSGGLDSCALLADCAARYGRVHPVYIRQDLAWEKVELLWLRRFLSAVRLRSIAPLTVLRVPMADVYGRHWSLGGRVPDHRSEDAAVYLPGRNLVMTVKAGVYCALKNIPLLALGSLSANPFPDATESFLALWSKGLSKGLATTLRIVAPYRRLQKAELIRRSRRWPLHFSFSCISPRGRSHCGRCNKCAERQKAFAAAGVTDRTRYTNPSPPPSPRRGEGDVRALQKTPSPRWGEGGGEGSRLP